MFMGKHKYTNNKKYHSVQHCGINPPPSQKKKKHPHFLALYICKLSKPPFLGNSPFHSDFSVSPQNISFSYLTQSYHLKVTEFFVMTEKNIFAYKLFLSLNISDFKIYIFSM